jgi:Replication protein
MTIARPSQEMQRSMIKSTPFPLQKQIDKVTHSVAESAACYTCENGHVHEKGTISEGCLPLVYLPKPRPYNEEKPKRDKLSRYSLLRRAQELSAIGDRIKLCQSPILVFGKFGREIGQLGGQLGKKIEVRKNVKNGRHSFGNLMNCRNVWQCPVCAARTAQKRGEDVKQAMEQHRCAGGVCDMHTYTFSHHYGDDLQEIERKMQSAMRRLKSGRWFQRFRHNIIGTINGKEVTHGKNGFHPHVHEILFLRRSWTDDERALWMTRWLEVLAIEGLEGSEEYAFHCRQDIKPTDYISKTGDMTLWGADKEILATHGKKGDGLNQWEILAASDDLYYADLWREYVKVYRGRRRLTWSRGLKEKFGIGDEQQEPQTEIVGTLTKQEFWQIYEKNDETRFLELIDELGFDLGKFTYFNIIHHLTIRNELCILRE